MADIHDLLDVTEKDRASLDKPPIDEETVLCDTIASMLSLSNKTGQDYLHGAIQNLAGRHEWKAAG